MSDVEERGKGVFENRPPKDFTWPAMFIFTAYGLLLFLPAIFSMLIVSAIPFGVLTFTLPILALAFAVVLLPFGFGNPHAARLATRYRPTLDPEVHAFLVQVTFSPRLRSGLRSFLEDADDIGWVYCRQSTLHFRGDSVVLDVPFDQVRAVRRENAGLRGLFLYSRTCIEFAGLPAAHKLWFAERSSCFLPASRTASRRLFASLADCAKLVRPAESVSRSHR